MSSAAASILTLSFARLPKRRRAIHPGRATQTGGGFSPTNRGRNAGKKGAERMLKN